MVGHNIHHKIHAAVMEGLRQRFKIVSRSKVRIQFVSIDDEKIRKTPQG